MDTPGSMVLLTRLAQRVYRGVDEDALGISLKQLAGLNTLREGGGTMTQQALGDALVVDANYLVVLLNSLEDAGHVERRQDPKDRRRHIVELTRSGQRALERAQQQLETIEDDVLARLDAGERAQLRELLARTLRDDSG